MRSIIASCRNQNIRDRHFVLLTLVGERATDSFCAQSRHEPTTTSENIGTLFLSTSTVGLLLRRRQPTTDTTGEEVMCVQEETVVAIVER